MNPPLVVVSLLIAGSGAACPAHAHTPDGEGRVLAAPGRATVEAASLTDARVGVRGASFDKSEAPLDEVKSAVISSQGAGPSVLTRVLPPPSPPVPLPPTPAGSLQIINIR